MSTTKNNENENKIEILDKTGEVIENENIIEFSKAYTFEGTTYESIDISGLDDISAADMVAVNKRMNRSGNVDFLPEMSLEYALEITARACKLPIEFFYGLRPKDAMKVKNKVTAFLYGAE